MWPVLKYTLASQVKKLLLNKRLLQTVDHQRIHFKLLTILKLEKGENI